MSFSAVGVVVVMIIAQRFCIMIEFRNAMFIYMKSNSVELTFIKLNFIILRFVCIECNKKKQAKWLDISLCLFGVYHSLICFVNWNAYKKQRVESYCGNLC